MKFTKDTPGALMIRSVSANEIKVGDTAYRQSIALTTDTVLTGWPDRRIEDLDVSDFDTVLAAQPELVIVGTGGVCCFAPRELTFAFARLGIGLEVMDTPAAARTYNVLASEGRQLAAVLYLD